MTIKTSIQVLATADIHSLASRWLLLEQQADNSFFLSWQWISSWLAMVQQARLQQPVFLIEAKDNDKTLGLGIFVENTRQVLKVKTVRQWYLHRTGIEKQDQIWIEHNDFLLEQSRASEIRQAMVAYLVTQLPTYKVDEVVIGLSATEVSDVFQKQFSLAAELVNSAGFWVNFAAIADYSRDVLSKNTRSQIKRSIKLLTNLGELSFRVESKPQACLQLLPAIADIHINRWQHTPEGSGFVNQEFVAFHQRLMLSKPNCLEIAVLSLNGEDIGFLMNYIANKQVNFYLSAIKLSPDNKIKTGLVLHTMAIEHYLKHGYNGYDFLAGYAQYKKSLSNANYHLTLNAYAQRHSLLWLEQKLKRLKGALTAHVKKLVNF